MTILDVKRFLNMSICRSRHHYYYLLDEWVNKRQPKRKYMFFLVFNLYMDSFSKLVQLDKILKSVTSLSVSDVPYLYFNLGVWKFLFPLFTHVFLVQPYAAIHRNLTKGTQFLCPNMSDATPHMSRESETGSTDELFCELKEALLNCYLYDLTKLQECHCGILDLIAFQCVIRFLFKGQRASYRTFYSVLLEILHHSKCPQYIRLLFSLQILVNFKTS